jgi:hypothetical protein
MKQWGRNLLSRLLAIFPDRERCLMAREFLVNMAKRNNKP